MAEKKKSAEDLEKKITCAICHNHYTDPKVLPCCHYYCKQCIHSLTLKTGVDRPFSCPECRKTTTLPQGGVDNLPTAFFINGMKAKYSTHSKEETKCQMCSRDKAKSFCMQCAMFICAKCVEQHKIMKVFAGHKTSTLEELEGGDKNILPKPALPTCKLHEEPMKYYCSKKGCTHIVCRDCIMLDHNEHRSECKPIQTAAMETRGKLIQQLEPLKNAKENMLHAVEQIETTESKLKTQEQCVTRDIEKAFQELQNIIENRKQEMLKDARVEFSEKLDHLSVQKEGLSTSCAEVQNVIDYTEQCVEHSADDEVMRMHMEIQSRIDREIEEQHKEEKNLEPAEKANIGIIVSCAEDLKQLCQTKAKLIIDSAVTGKGTKSAEVNKLSEFQVTAKLSNGKPTKLSPVVECHLKRLACGSISECKVDAIKCGEYRIQYTPTVRGRHELTVTVNGQEVAGSPFPVFVSIHPTLLGKPVRVIPELKHPNGIAMTSAEEIVVSEFDGDVVTLNKEGKLLRIIMRSDHNLLYPRGVAVDEEDNIYFIDQEVNKISKCDRLMQTVLAKDTVKRDRLGHYAVAAVSGEIIVCERVNKGVLKVYSKKLDYIEELKSKEENCGDCYAVCSDEHGNFFVTDKSKKCVRVMTRSGDVLRSFSCDQQGVEKLKFPAGLCVSGQYVYVSNWNSHNIVVFTTEGDYVTSFGQEGTKEGEFKLPVDLCVDKDGFLYICDAFNDRIQVF